MATTRVVPKDELLKWVHQLPISATVAILLGGDRLSCVDEAVGVEVEGKIVAIATIAPQGEMMSGQPTIVALYTLKAHRQKGYGALALKAAIVRGKERGFSQLRVDVLSSHVMRILDSLTGEEKNYLDVHEMDMMFDLFLFAE